MQVSSYAENQPKHFRRGQSWKINLFGKNSDIATPDPQAFRLDLNAHQKLDSHFRIVDQFQVFIAGSGTIGRDQCILSPSTTPIPIPATALDRRSARAVLSDPAQQDRCGPGVPHNSERPRKAEATKRRHRVRLPSRFPSSQSYVIARRSRSIPLLRNNLATMGN